MLYQQISTRAQKAIDDRIFPGCVIGYVRKNGERHVIPCGRFTYEQDAAVVQEDSIYDTASLTKSIPTGSLALQLIDDGKLKLTDKLVDFIPEFRNSDREHVLIQHLLTYTLDGYGLASAVAGHEQNSVEHKTAAELYEILMTHDFGCGSRQLFIAYAKFPFL